MNINGAVFLLNVQKFLLSHSGLPSVFFFLIIKQQSLSNMILIEEICLDDLERKITLSNAVLFLSIWLLLKLLYYETGSCTFKVVQKNVNIYHTWRNVQSKEMSYQIIRSICWKTEFLLSKLVILLCVISSQVSEKILYFRTSDLYPTNGKIIYLNVTVFISLVL